MTYAFVKNNAGTTHVGLMEARTILYEYATSCSA